ncbi:MAG: TGS domain-containing protein [Candidatus Peregrinibacteria bacterium]|nr:TGS domain-containing protein [Candidatus Peregrinibacteria bacterium]
MATQALTKTEIKSREKEFKKWLDFLLSVKIEGQNTELITHFFFVKFSESPETLFQFLRFMEKKLQTSREARKKKEIASKYLLIMSRLCERFGLYEEKSRLDDQCFKITNPREYREIERRLKDFQAQANTMVNRIDRTLKSLMKENDHKVKIIGRYKDVYSISRKLKKKSVKNVFKINDLLAFRIIVPGDSTNECYEILDLLHDQYYPVVTSFKDYITIPKVNGYQSLHTGLTEVVPDLDLPVEVQIRTEQMNDFAEQGLASHWIYSERKKARLLSDKEQKLLQHYTELSRSVEQENMVYFLSSFGDVFRLENGASIIDFAYRIHTDVGRKLKSATVNGKKVDIHYKIQECDKIRINQGKVARAERDWLDHTTIKNTRKKIYESIRSQRGL